MLTASRRHFIPCLETLEDRQTPAGTVTGSFAAGIWTLTGDGLSNDITVNSTGTPGSFTLIGNGTTVAGVTNRTNVRSIVIDFQDGADTVTFNNNAMPIKLARTLTINGGDGNNQVLATALTVTRKVSISNSIGFDTISLTDFRAKASMVISNGDGGSSLGIATSSAAFGFNLIAGNFSVTSGAGYDAVNVADTNVLGNIAVNAGSGDGTNAGAFLFYNGNQTATRALIGGSVNVTFQDGDINANTILDAKVQGNVTFNNGSGNSTTRFDGSVVNQQVVIAGNLTINGTGSNTVLVGAFPTLQTGLKVRGNFTLNLGMPAANLELFHLNVVGSTTIQ